MSEKRFSFINDGVCWIIKDNAKREILSSVSSIVDLLNEQQTTIKKQEEIIKSQDMEISRQYNLCLAMCGVLREEFGVYDVFDRSKDKRVK